MIKCNCYKCTKRSVGCHSKCQDYAEYTRKLKQSRDDVDKYYVTLSGDYAHIAASKTNFRNFKPRKKNYVIGGQA